MRIEVIQTEYDELDAIAGRFAKHAESTVDMRSHIKNGVQALQNGKWEGQGSAAFFAEMERDVFPVMTRLTAALEQAQAVTLQAKEILQTAEEEAARPFEETITGFVGSPADNISNTIAVGASSEDDNGGVLGWISDKAGAVGDFIVDHRDEIALGGTVIAAGIATVATGGLAAPIIAGAVAAGGITLAINAASPKYPLMDGVLGNTFKGGIIGLGAGSIGTAVRSISMFGSGTGAAIAQMTGSSSLGSFGGQAFGATKLVAGITSGLSTITSQGGLDIFIPEQYESSVHHLSNQIGMVAAVTDLGTSFVGNKLIQHAWNNPIPYKTVQNMKLSSTEFQAHHLHPTALGGTRTYGDTVFVATFKKGAGGPFLRNLHTAQGGIHPSLNRFLQNSYGVNGVKALKSMAIDSGVINSFYQNIFIPSLQTSTIPSLLQSAVFAGSR